jgi:ATP/maltotriose-dependent transcriptional regulator MalT
LNPFCYNQPMFIATKLFLPPIQPGLVSRPRLFDVLDDAWNTGQRLILLSAPPGYGKTTLLSEWIAVQDTPAIWLALDDKDNDPVRFFQYMLLALKQHAPGLEELLSTLNTLHAANLEILITEVINQLVQNPQPILLVLDDYHLVHNSENHALVQYLLDHQPPQFHLAIVSRQDPPLNLARLRARRQMCEIRQRDLSFSAEEAGQLLQTERNLSLDNNQVQQLSTHTEGWVVGLQLAALSLRDHPDPNRFIEDFSGSHRFVIDYLYEEVFSRLPEDLRRFLHQSAALDRFCPDLLDAALETTHSTEMLYEVEAANLFLVPLDDNRTWFRYHHLMTDILRSELAPDEIHAIQRRAAQWLIAHDQPLEAVQYAFAASDLTLTCRLIRQAAIPVVESGQLTEVLRWLDALPEAVLLDDTYLAVLRAWFLIYNGRFREAALWIQKLQDTTSGLDDLLASPETRPLAGLLLGLQTWLPSTTGRKMDFKKMEQAYALMGDHFPIFSPLLLLALGQTQIGDSRSEEARLSFEEGITLADSAGSSVTALILRNNLAFLLNNIGERSEAIDLCRAGVAQYSTPDGKPGLLAGIPMIVLGCLLYQSGELDEANTVLTTSIHLVQRLGLYHVLAMPANQTLQLLLSDQGKLEDALTLNRETQRQAAKVGLTAAASHMDMLAAWLHYYAGNPDPARQWVDSHPLQGSFTDQLSALPSILIHTRILAESGQGDQALNILQKLETLTQTAARKLDWIRVKVEQALTLHHRGKTQQAIAALTLAVEAAAPMAYRQLFVQERPRLASLLEHFRPRFPRFIELICTQEPNTATGDTVLIDPPTDREMEILRLVAAGLSNSDIAGRLYITVGTTKWHLNHLYAKLGVSRRTEAVAKARELSLI